MYVSNALHCILDAVFCTELLTDREHDIQERISFDELRIYRRIYPLVMVGRLTMCEEGSDNLGYRPRKFK